LVGGFGTLNYGFEDPETVPPHVAIAAGLAEKPSFS
jgi:hypothetical protein